MKRCSLILLMCICSSYSAIAQNFDDLYENALKLYYDGKYTDAIQIGQKALLQAKQTYTGSSFQAVKTLNLLGLSYDQLNNFKEAIPFYEKAATFLRLLKPADTLLAKYIYDYGYCLYENQQYEDAVSPLKEALILCRRAQYTDAVLYAHIINALSQAYAFSGRYAQAEPLAKENYKFWQSRNIINDDKANAANNLGLIYHFQGAYRSAFDYYEQAIALKRQAVKENSPDYAVSLKNMANLYGDMHDLRNADSLFQVAMEILRQAPGGESREDYISAYIELAKVYAKSTQLDHAIRLYRRAFELIMKYGGTSNVQIIRCLTGMADLLTQQRQYDKADTILRQAIQIRIASDGEDGLRTAYAKDHLGAFYQTIGRPLEAERYLLQADTIYLRRVGKVSLDHAHVLSNLALVYQQLARFREARDRHLSSLAILSSMSPTPILDYVTEMGNYGEFLLLLGEWNSADSVYKSALNFLEREKWTETKAYVWTLKGLANAQRHIGLSQQALDNLNKAIRIWQNITSDEDPDTAPLFEDVSDLYSEFPNLSLAKEYAEKALRINEKAFSKNSSQYAGTLQKLAYISIDNGDYAQAASAIEQTLAIQKNTAGIKSTTYATTLATYARIQGYQGKKNEAEKNFLNALSIFENSQTGYKSRDYLIAMSNFSIFYDQDDKKDKAEIYARGALSLAEQLYGLNNDYCIRYENNLAQIYINGNKLKEAEALLKRIINSSAKQSFPSIYANALNNLGGLYVSQEDYAKAEIQVTASVSNCKDLYGEHSLIYSKALLNLATITYLEKKFSAAEAAYSKAMPIKFSNAERNLAGLTSGEKLKWWQQANLEAQFGPVLLTTDTAADNKFIEEVCKEQLTLKAYLLNDEAKILHQAYISSDSTTKKLLSDWRNGRAQITAQYNLPIKKRLPSLDSLRGAVDALEKQINSSVLRHIMPEKISLHKISTALKADEAAIEFIRYGYFAPNKEKSFRYAAIILLHSNSIPHFIPLFNETQLKALLSNQIYGSSNEFEQLYGITDSGTNPLFQLAFEPLMPYLSNINSIFISPAGLLNRIAFKALPINSSQRLIDKFHIKQVLSIRELENLEQNSANMHGKWLLYGGINYNNSVNSKEGASIAALPAFLRPGVRSGSWPDLPGTLAEVNEIATVLTNAHVGSKVITDTAATKSSFLNLSGHSPLVLHIATHGFFLSDAQSSATSIDGDPLFRSGLIMAGGNTKDNSGAAQGILTAYEIANMDLSTTRLVVLSACETALGDLNATEGVFGLQRAFRLAGVNQMVISLWKVTDQQQTSELMSTFYSKLISGLSVEDAFNDAQREMSRRYSPYYWAAFELIQ